ncbi:hypothetical protein O3M35_012608 [Rhynocoris fuscipes]|uniref:V-type proton ATPase subunit S1/VOA1 transmembrane domain-containing protein n=1 Tax=Rhynocoris fuscipes TaxID=488301 RepID=A0AAW1CYN9_9HEMI
MANFRNKCLLSILLFSLFNCALSGVPVLLWESSSTLEKQEIIPALYQLDTDEFSNHIWKKVHTHKPLIVVFIEETLSVEDFSWQDVQHQGSFPQLRNLTKTSARVEFIPSVEYPLDALKTLVENHKYQWEKYDRNNLPTKGSVLLEVKMQDPLNNEDRPDLLRRHDKNIAEIYSQLLSKHSSIIAIFTGKQSSWVELESNRVRREADEINSSSTRILGSSKNNYYRIEPYASPVLQVRNETVYLNTSIGQPQMDDRTNFTRLIIQYKDNNGSKLIFRYRFEKDEEKNTWSLNYVEFQSDSNAYELYPEKDITASIGKSFSDSNPVIFKPKNESDIELRFPKGLQAQPYMEDMEFNGTEVTPVGFFTPAIWSGLITSFLLGLVLTWGIVMLLDIKTMDRFDDPKGKTISTAAAE